MPGDLEIRLFLFSCTFLAGIEAMKAEGWRLYVFWAVCAAFGLAGLGWSWIFVLSPTVANWIAQIATSPQSWFVLLALGLLLIAATSPQKPKTIASHGVTAETAVIPIDRPKPPVEIEFRWRPAGHDDPIQIDVLITALRNVKDLAIIGTAATATYYMTGEAEWEWHPSVRLLASLDFFKGENNTTLVLSCDRKDSTKKKGVLLLNTHIVPVRNSQMILLRVTVVSTDREWPHEAAYFVKRLGEFLDVQTAPASALEHIKDNGKQA
jgi:hypothetical protein